MIGPQIRIGLLAALLTLGGCATASEAPKATAASAPTYHAPAPNSVVGFLVLTKTGDDPLTSAEVQRAQACKDQAVAADPALGAPSGAPQLSKLMNTCLGAGAVFTLPWQGNTPIDTYLN